MRFWETAHATAEKCSIHKVEVRLAEAAHISKEVVRDHLRLRGSYDASFPADIGVIRSYGVALMGDEDSFLRPLVSAEQPSPTSADELKHRGKRVREDLDRGLGYLEYNDDMRQVILDIFTTLWDILSLYEISDGYNCRPDTGGLEGAEEYFDAMLESAREMANRVGTLRHGSAALYPRRWQVNRLLRIIDETELFVKSYLVPGVNLRWREINPRLNYYDPVLDMVEELSPEAWRRLWYMFGYRPTKWDLQRCGSGISAGWKAIGTARQGRIFRGNCWTPWSNCSIMILFVIQIKRVRRNVALRDDGWYNENGAGQMNYDMGGKKMTTGQTRMQKPHYGTVELLLKNQEYVHMGLSTEENASAEGAAEKYKANPGYPWEYDFKYEYYNIGRQNAVPAPDLLWNLDEEKDPIKRLLKYKKEYKDNNKWISSGQAFDCDGSGEKFSCDLVRKIYRKLWDWKDIDADGKKQRYGTMGSNPWVAVGPDTMNSFMTVFIHFSKETWNKGVKYVSAKTLYEQLVKEDGCSLEKYLENPDMTTRWKSFAVFTHSIGNFILVPAGFNGKRGISPVIHDFWDLSLVYLKRRIKETTWLNEANAFTKYINYFFLWDYVGCTDGETDYRVKSLLSESFRNGGTKYNDRHIGVSDGDSTMPNVEKEIPVFIDNALWAIKRRGIFMTAMLWLASAMEPEKYGELRDQVFMTDHRYGGYSDVIIEIEKIIEEKSIEEAVKNAIEKAQIANNAEDIIKKMLKALAELKS